MVRYPCCDKGKSHLEIEGPVPASFAAIQGELLEEQVAHGGEQAAVEFLFDAPIQLAKELTGFRHDEDVHGTSGDFFLILERAEESPIASFGKALSGLFRKRSS